MPLLRDDALAGDVRRAVEAIEAEARPDEATVRGALIRSGLVWVIPADMFDEAVAVVTRELANGPFVPAPEPHRPKL